MKKKIGRQKTKEGMETNRWRYKSKYFPRFWSEHGREDKFRLVLRWFERIKFDIFDDIGQKIKAKWLTEFDIRPDRF